MKTNRLLNRSVVYTLVGVSLVGLYLTVILLLDWFFRTATTWWIATIATALVAVTVQPMRARVQTLVNQWLYGQWDDPEEVLRRLGDQLEGADNPEDVPGVVVRKIGETLHLPYVAMALFDAGTLRVVAEYETGVLPPMVNTENFPLTIPGQTLGELRLVTGENRALTDRERRLIQRVTVFAGLVLQSVSLTRELRRVLETGAGEREDERRRLRRDLHDGIVPSLAQYALSVEGARGLLETDKVEAGLVLDEVAEMLRGTARELRAITGGLRPTALDELGLIGVLRQQTRINERSGMRLTIRAPDSLPPLPAAVESTAYWITREALNNVRKHARASEAVVEVTPTPSELVVKVIDDGEGLAPDYTLGMGMISMRERALEVGGDVRFEQGHGRGTQVEAHLPLRL